MTRVLRQVPFPETPAEVEACLDLAEAGAIIVERSNAPAIVIMPATEYERLDALDRLAAVHETEAGDYSAASDPAL